jgi:uncharacterized membrane protein
MLDTKKSVIRYLLTSIFCFLSYLIYSKYSHNVSSIYMTYMFIIPLIGLTFQFLSKNIIYHNLLASSIFTLTLSSFLEGIVEIAGTKTTYVYLLLILGIIMFIISLFFIKKSSNN